MVNLVYLFIFEFFIPAVRIVQTVYENALLFSLEYQIRGLTVVYGGPNTTVMPRRGPYVRPHGEGASGGWASERPSGGGLQLYSAGTAGVYGRMSVTRCFNVSAGDN